MSTEEPKPESSPDPDNDSKVEPSAAPSTAPSAEKQAAPPDVDAGVAWPPPEAAPAGDGAASASNGAGATSVTDAAKPAEPGPNDSGVMTAPESKPAAKAAAADAEMPAATPQEEMGLSNSTLHWLEDGDQAVPGRLTEPGSMPSYDPRAPVPGRKRAVLVVGLAGLVAVIVAGTLYGQAQRRRATEPATPVVVEPARDITTRAEKALAANKLDEALDLANLALVADQRFADAHFVVAIVKRAHNQPAEARDAFRKYLDLAPLGTHAAEARAALASLPP
jgi:hypothetical protein